MGYQACPCKCSNHMVFQAVRVPFGASTLAFPNIKLSIRVLLAILSGEIDFIFASHRLARNMAIFIYLFIYLNNI